MQLIWLRSDLRLHDNTALSAATQRGPTVALYLLSPRQWQAHDDAPCKVDFWLRNLEQLSGDLARLNIPLLIRQAPSWEQAPRCCCNCAGNWPSRRCTSTRNMAFTRVAVTWRWPAC